MSEMRDIVLGFLAARRTCGGGSKVSVVADHLAGLRADSSSAA